MRYFIKLFVYTVCIYIGFCGAVLACGVNEIDVLGDGTQCETAKFSITTTELVADTTFAFYMSAQGTFYVDWGDGTVDTITRNDTTITLYDHTYTTGGRKSIRFSGLATGYSTQEHASAIRFGFDDSGSDNPTPQLVAGIAGSIGQIFPTLAQSNVGQPAFIDTFSRTVIPSIPENLFRGVTGARTSMFERTFASCSVLREIPAGLFNGIYGNASYLFFNTFLDCISLVDIPNGLFSGITGSAPGLFRATFEQCRSLRSIPENLFAGVYGGAERMFRYTFKSCGSLTSIPKNLFANVTTPAKELFYYTFRDCPGLRGYIPPSMFAGLIANGSPTVTNMWYETFDNTQLATSCPAGTVQFITGYESRWGGHVSCVDESLVCGVGEYLPAHWYECKTCPENHYCAGGTYPYSETNSNGTTQCPTGLFAPSGMWEAEQCGRILHVGDGFVYLRSTKKTSPSLHLDLDHDGVADYFGNMTTLDVPMSHGTSRKLKVRMNGIVYSIYDDSVDLGAQ